MTLAGISLLSLGVAAQPETDSAPPPVAVAAGAPALPADLPPGLAQVVKLSESNVGDQVILAYIKNSGQSFNPTADEILYLKDVGVSDAVVTALLQSPPASVVTPSPASIPAPVVQSVPPPPAPATVYPSAPTEEVSVNYFEEQLSPYGSWVEVPEYGRCWQPAVVVVNREWRPYSDRGRWIYTDAGWYWQSDYSWGWAAFHYGRWFNHGRYGWVWAPDSTWGPSWVCWRQTETHCGWAPLPPAARFEAGVGLVFHHNHVGVNFDFGLSLGLFTFVGFDHFCDRDVHRYYVPRHEAVTIYNRSTVINNYTVINRTVVNEGVGREHVAARAQRPVPRVAIHETHETTASHPTPGRAERVDRNSVTVFRPTPAVMASHAAAPRREPFVVNHSSVSSRSTVNDRNGNSRNSSSSPVATSPHHNDGSSTSSFQERNNVAPSRRGNEAPLTRDPGSSSRNSTVTSPNRSSESSSVSSGRNGFAPSAPSANSRTTITTPTTTPSRSSSGNAETSRTSRNVTIYHDPPATPAPSARSTTTFPETRSTRTESIPSSRSDASGFSSRPSEPFSTGRHAVEHPVYQPRGWTGNTESAPSSSHGSSSGSVISPHQSSAPSVTHESHSYSAPPAAPARESHSSSAPQSAAPRESSSSSRTGQDKQPK